MHLDATDGIAPTVPIGKFGAWGARTARAEFAVMMKELLKFELNGYGQVRRYRIAVQLRGLVLPMA